MTGSPALWGYAMLVAVVGAVILWISGVRHGKQKQEVKQIAKDGAARDALIGDAAKESPQALAEAGRAVFADIEKELKK